MLFLSVYISFEKKRKDVLLQISTIESIVIMEKQKQSMLSLRNVQQSVPVNCLNTNKVSGPAFINTITMKVPLLLILLVCQ